MSLVKTQWPKPIDAAKVRFLTGVFSMSVTLAPVSRFCLSQAAEFVVLVWDYAVASFNRNTHHRSSRHG